MNHRECHAPGPRRGLLFVLFAALLFAAATAAGCSDPEKTKAEHLSRGESYLKERKFQEASLEFRNAIQIDERSAEAHWGLARAFEGMLSTDASLGMQVIAELQRTIALAPDNLDARVRLGNYYALIFQQSKDARWKDEATKLADEVLQKDPNHIEGHILRGTVLFAAGDRAGALAELQRAVELNPRRVESLMGLALFYRQTGDAAKADETYRRALEIDGRSALAHLEYARFFVSQNRPGEAEQHFRHAVEVDPQSREARRTLATFYIQQKQFDRAEEVVRALAELDRDKPEGRAVLAEFYSQVGRADDAARVLQEIVTQWPDYAQGRQRLAELLLARGDLAGAQAQVKEALAKNQNDQQALLLRARLALVSGDAKAAIEDLKQVLKQDARHRAGLYYMAEANVRANQLEQARIFAGDLERFYPGYLPGKMMRVQIALSSADWQGAQRQSNELLDSLSRAVPDAHVSQQLIAELRSKALTARGATHLQLKNAAAARADFEAARDAEPNSPASHTNLAGVALAEGKRDEARAHFERALSIDPANFDAMRGLSEIYTAEQKFAEAHARLDQGLAARPSSAPLRFLKADLYVRQRGLAARAGDAAQRDQLGRQAEAELLRALEIDPGFIPAFDGLSKLYLSADQPDRALAELARWAERRPDDANPHVLAGMIEDRRQNYDASCEHYRRALTLRPDDIFASNNLAWNYAEHGKGNLDEAMRLAQSVVQRHPDVAGFADTLGWVYFKKGLHGAAVEQLQKAVERASAGGEDAPSYRVHLAQALAAAGRKAEARQQLQQALNSKSNPLPADRAEQARRALATL
jgi:tetratricopeptide (TPR) repeat protein